MKGSIKRLSGRTLRWRRRRGGGRRRRQGGCARTETWNSSVGQKSRSSSDSYVCGRKRRQTCELKLVSALPPPARRSAAAHRADWDAWAISRCVVDAGGLEFRRAAAWDDVRRDMARRRWRQEKNTSRQREVGRSGLCAHRAHHEHGKRPLEGRARESHGLGCHFVPVRL